MMLARSTLQSWFATTCTTWLCVSTVEALVHSWNVPDGAPTTEQCVQHHADLAALRLSAASCALRGTILSQIETLAFDKEHFKGDG